MPPIDEYALKPQQIELGLKTIKQRQRNLMLMSFVSISVLIVAAVALFIQQDLVYSFFGLSPTVQQLHIPLSAGELSYHLGSQSDYFSLFSLFCSASVISTNLSSTSLIHSSAS